MLTSFSRPAGAQNTKSDVTFTARMRCATSQSHEPGMARLLEM
jgi:hypothetical protein